MDNLNSFKDLFETIPVYKEIVFLMFSLKNDVNFLYECGFSKGEINFLYKEYKVLYLN